RKLLRDELAARLQILESLLLPHPLRLGGQSPHPVDDARQAVGGGEDERPRSRDEHGRSDHGSEDFAGGEGCVHEWRRRRSVSRVIFSSPPGRKKRIESGSVANQAKLPQARELAIRLKGESLRSRCRR